MKCFRVWHSAEILFAFLRCCCWLVVFCLVYGKTFTENTGSDTNWKLKSLKSVYTELRSRYTQKHHKICPNCIYLNHIFHNKMFVLYNECSFYVVILLDGNPEICCPKHRTHNSLRASNLPCSKYVYKYFDVLRRESQITTKKNCSTSSNF